MRVDIQYTELHGNHKFDVRVKTTVWNEEAPIATHLMWMVRPGTRSHRTFAAQASSVATRYERHTGIYQHLMEGDFDPDTVDLVDGYDLSWHERHDGYLQTYIRDSAVTQIRGYLQSRNRYDLWASLAEQYPDIRWDANISYQVSDEIHNAYAEQWRFNLPARERYVWASENLPRIIAPCEDPSHEDTYNAVVCAYGTGGHPLCEATDCESTTYLNQYTCLRGDDNGERHTFTAYLCEDHTPTSREGEGRWEACGHCGYFFDPAVTSTADVDVLIQEISAEWQDVTSSVLDHLGLVFIAGRTTRPLTDLCARSIYEDASTLLEGMECDNCMEMSANARVDRRNLCSACDEAMYEWRVNTYSFKPQPNFLPELPDDPRDLYHGFEFEVAGMNHRRACSWAQEQNIDPNFIYLKSDSSVNSGTEVVTHPFTFPWALENFPFDAFDAALDDYGAYESDSSAGTHIHVSKASFSRAHMWKFLQVHFRLPTLLQKLGGRGDTGYASWRLAPVRLEAKKVAMKQRASTGRLAVNVSPTHTVELRYPAGGFSSFLARKNIELPNALYQFSSEITMQNIKDGIIDKDGYLLWWLQQERAQFPTLNEYAEQNIPIPTPFERSN